MFVEREAMSVLTQTLEITAGQPPLPDDHEAVSTLAWRRAFLKLPLAERRRQMTAQAAQLLEHYQAEADTRADWQGGDIIEY